MTIVKQLVNRFKRGFNLLDEQPVQAVKRYSNAPFEQYDAIRQVPAGTPPCLAPWTSLSFNIDGTASICCLNKTTSVNAIGKSIAEIWNSEPFQQLRDSITASNLNHDCEICLHQIQAGNFTSSKSIDYDKFYPANPAYPQVMEFCLENTCNL